MRCVLVNAVYCIAGKPTKWQLQPTAQHKPPAVLQARPQSAAPTSQLTKPPVPKQQPSKLEQQLEYLDYSDYESEFLQRSC